MRSITEVQMICPNCNWTGPVADCEPDVDGDGSLGCPECEGIVTETETEKERMRLYTVANNRLKDLQDDYMRKRADIHHWLERKLIRLEE